jgi:hypothetical protein
MKNRTLLLVASLVAVSVVAVAATRAMASPRLPKYFSGTINDYTPASTVMPAGPWEVRGTWNLKFDEQSAEKADFSAAVTMELPNPTDVDTPSTRMQHTHHLTVHGGCVTPIPGGFQVSGAVTITKDGGPAPAALQGSTLVIAITGGADVEYSNITLTFLDGATTHFGTEPIHGVVRRTE